jgi:hypothetical protein
VFGDECEFGDGIILTFPIIGDHAKFGLECEVILDIRSSLGSYSGYPTIIKV